MRLRRHAQLLEPTLKTAIAARPSLLCRSRQSPLSQCRYQSASNAPPNNIAVFGGGVSGLASAYFLSKEFPKCKITIFEAGKETGGWIRSKRVEVPGGDILFEMGPRTLRSSMPTLHLIEELGLTKDILATPKSAPGAKNRFVYYPDRLNRMPSGVPSASDVFALWRSGLFAGITGIIKEPLMPKRPDSLSDETVGSFLSRRVDQRMANNIVSAVFHGIYAGDIWQLSAKSLLAGLWHLEGKYGSALGGYLRMNSDGGAEVITLSSPYTVRLSALINAEIDLDPDVTEVVKDASMFTFKRGMQQLVQGLQRAIHKHGNVEIRTETPVQETTASFMENGKTVKGLEVVSGHSSTQKTETYELAINTLRQPDLTPYVTVMTVNLFYSNPDLLPVQGFGYLIPQSIPFEQNPERALGVIFDSSATQGQDTAPGTKLTVMMGGHWWDGWDAYPTEAEGLEMAQAIVQRHLGISDTPVAHIANLAKDCIPQYTLGYADRVRDFANNDIPKYHGRMKYVGSQVSGGVGVNDCITGAWRLAKTMKRQGWDNTDIGLSHVLDQSEWVPVPLSLLAYHGGARRFKAHEKEDEEKQR